MMNALRNRILFSRVSLLAALAVIGLSGLSWTAWGEGVDIFPLGNGPGGGAATGDDDPGASLASAAIYRRDGGSIGAQAGRQGMPGLILEDIEGAHLFAGRAKDGGPMPVAFELRLESPELLVRRTDRGVKTSGVMTARDLDPADHLDLLLDAGRRTPGVMLLFVGKGPIHGEGLGRFSRMKLVQTVRLADSQVNLGELRSLAVQALPGQRLRIGVLVVDDVGQWALAQFNVHDDEAVFEVYARDTRGSDGER